MSLSIILSLYVKMKFITSFESLNESKQYAFNKWIKSSIKSKIWRMHKMLKYIFFNFAGNIIWIMKIITKTKWIKLIDLIETKYIAIRVTLFILENVYFNNIFQNVKLSFFSIIIIFSSFWTGFTWIILFFSISTVFLNNGSSISFIPAKSLLIFILSIFSLVSSNE